MLCFFRSHFLSTIPEENADVEGELGFVTNGHHVKDGEETDVDLAVAPFVDDDNHLQSIAISLPPLPR